MTKVGGLQQVGSGHPVQEGPGRLARDGSDPQDCFHSGRLSLAYAGITEWGGNRFAHPFPSTLAAG